MKKTILIAFELDDNGNGENLDQIGSKFFASLVLDKIKFNGVSITPIRIDRNRLLEIEQTDEPEPKPSGHLTRFNTGSFRQPGLRSNAEIRRRNGGVKHQFEDDIGGCSANYQ